MLSDKGCSVGLPVGVREWADGGRENHRGTHDRLAPTSSRQSLGDAVKLGRHVLTRIYAKCSLDHCLHVGGAGVSLGTDYAVVSL